MHRHRTFVQFLVKKLLELYCPDSNGHTIYSKRFCRDEFAFNISKKLGLDILLIPGEEVLFDFINHGICSEATEEKMANLYYQGTDLQQRPALLKDFLFIAKRKQVTAKPCFNRFVQQFFGEAKTENHLPENPKVWMSKLSVKELKFVKVTSTKLLKELEKKEKMNGRRKRMK